ncbi:MAG: DUF5666 domain-containing protein, partial [Gammaproteobacteria bacterium]
CGGSLETAGIGGTGISYGTVTDFGSIIVNGSRLDDSTATVTLDGIPGDVLLPHRGLKQGMVVKVSGTFSGNTGTASTIEYKDNLEGEVCALAAPIVPPIVGIITLRVLGQTVILDATTFVDNSTTIINAGDIVEVSGLRDDLEEIHASFSEVKTSTTEVEVKGRIDAVDDIAKVLTINALNVNYLNIPGSAPVVDQYVEVKGTVFSCGGAIDTLTATSVELEPEGAGVIPTGDHAEVEGLITEGLNLGSFKIGGQEVLINGSTRFLPEDFDAGDILVGAKVEAEGSTSTNGVLAATKITFRENVKLESNVATVSGNSPTFSFTLVGLPGITITTNSATTPFPASPPSGHIRVRGIEGPNNTVLAIRIEDRGGSANAFLQGTVDREVGTEITILGITVDTILIVDNFPDSNPNFEDVHEQGISRATFLDLVQPGTLVKFKGDIIGVSITWDEAELEDD